MKYWEYSDSLGNYKLNKVLGKTSLNLKGAKIDNISTSQEIKNLLVQNGAFLEIPDQNT